MKLAAMVILSMAFSNPTRKDKERTPPPLSALQGAWTLLETADQHRSDRGDDNIRMKISSDDVTMTFGELTTNRGTIGVGTANRLKTIDLKFANGRALLGIYETERGVLTMCVDDAAKGRPNTFAPQGTQWVEKWKQLQP